MIIRFSFRVDDQIREIAVSEGYKIVDLISKIEEYLPSNKQAIFMMSSRRVRGINSYYNRYTNAYSNIRPDVYCSIYSNHKIDESGKISIIDISNIRKEWLPNKYNILTADAIIINNPLMIKNPYCMMINKEYVKLPHKTDTSMYEKILILYINIKKDIDVAIWMELAPNSYCMALLLSSVPFVDNISINRCFMKIIEDGDMDALELLYSNCGTLVYTMMERGELTTHLLNFINKRGIVLNSVNSISTEFKNYDKIFEDFIMQDPSQRLPMVKNYKYRIKLLEEYLLNIDELYIPNIIIDRQKFNMDYKKSFNINNIGNTLAEIRWAYSRSIISLEECRNVISLTPYGSIYLFLKEYGCDIYVNDNASCPAMENRIIKEYYDLVKLTPNKIKRMISQTRVWAPSHADSLIYFLKEKIIDKFDILESFR